MSFFEPEFRNLESGVNGPTPSAWYGGNAVDGDAYPWLQAPIGAIYYYLSGTNQMMYQKVDNNGRDDDWSLLGGSGVISERISVADFTDGAGTDGTLSLSSTIPAGALVTRVQAVNVTGWAGDTSAVFNIGDDATSADDDRYNASAGLDVFASAVAVDGGIPQGEQVHILPVVPVVTCTTASDFTACKTNGAGRATIKIYYNF